MKMMMAKRKSRSYFLKAVAASSPDSPVARPKAKRTKMATELNIARRDVAKNFLKSIFAQPTEKIIAKVEEGMNFERNIHLLEFAAMCSSISFCFGMWRYKNSPKRVPRSFLPSQYQARSPDMSAKRTNPTTPKKFLKSSSPWKASQRVAKETTLPTMIIEMYVPK